jgi:hypothetical protein
LASSIVSFASMSVAASLRIGEPELRQQGLEVATVSRSSWGPNTPDSKDPAPNWDTWQSKLLGN